MATKGSKYAQNIQGPFYVDDQCIACDACVVEAPDYFSMNDEAGHAFVYKQPSNQTEWDICQNALEACPVNAIGSDA